MDLQAILMVWAAACASATPMNFIECDLEDQMNRKTIVWQVHYVKYVSGPA